MPPNLIKGICNGAVNFVKGGDFLGSRFLSMNQYVRRRDVQMKKVVAIVSLSFFLIIGLSAIGPVQAKTVEWKAQTLFGPEDASTAIQAQGLVNATNAALKGKLHTTLYQSGQLVPPEEMSAGLARGVYDAALMVPMMRSEAGAVAFGMPFGLQGYDQVIEFYYDFGFLDFMRKIDAKKNIFFGCPLPFGPITLLSEFPVHKLEDLKGKKIWSEGPTAALVDALGGEPVWFDPSEVYMGLKLGTIDGVIFGLAELETLKLKEVVKYIMMPAPINPIVLDWVISLDSWKKLPQDTKQMYEKAMKGFLKKQYEECMADNNKGLDAAKAYGVQVIDLKPAELKKFRAAAMKVWDELAKKDKESAQAVQMLRDYLKSKGIKSGE